MSGGDAIVVCASREYITTGFQTLPGITSLCADQLGKSRGVNFLRPSKTRAELGHLYFSRPQVDPFGFIRQVCVCARGMRAPAIVFPICDTQHEVGPVGDQGAKGLPSPARRILVQRGIRPKSAQLKQNVILLLQPEDAH